CGMSPSDLHLEFRGAGLRTEKHRLSRDVSGLQFTAHLRMPSDIFQERARANASVPVGAHPELLRGLNVWHATSIVAGTIIGSGIFLVPQEMMQAVGSAGLVYLA